MATKDDDRWFFEIDPWVNTRAPFPVAADPKAQWDPFALEAGINEAWGDLLRRHMPCHEPTESERARLYDLLEGLEMPPPLLKLRPQEAPQMKVRLMEQAYQILRLGRYANAPANRGWMNLFRRWAGDPDVDAAFTASRRYLPLNFVEFYEDFVWQYRGSSIDENPVRHPWDPRDREGDEVPEEARPDEERTRWDLMLGYFGMRVQRRRYPRGIYLDSGTIDGISDERGADAATSGGTDPHGGQPAGADTNP